MSPGWSICSQVPRPTLRRRIRLVDMTLQRIESQIVNENGLDAPQPNTPPASLVKNMSLQKHTIGGTRVKQWIPGHVGEKELRRHDR